MTIIVSVMIIAHHRHPHSEGTAKRQRERGKDEGTHKETQTRLTASEDEPPRMFR